MDNAAKKSKADRELMVCFRTLIEKILAVSISSSDAERGFSIQNNVKADQRFSLLHIALEAIMNLRINGKFETFPFPLASRKWISDVLASNAV